MVTDLTFEIFNLPRLPTHAPCMFAGRKSLSERARESEREREEESFGERVRESGRKRVSERE